MKLFLVELRRAWLRTAVRFLSLAMILGAVGIVGYTTFVSTRPVTASEIAAAQSIAAQQPTMSAADIAACEQERASQAASGQDVTGWSCSPSTAADFVRHPATIWESLAAQPMIVGMLLALVGLVCGATFIGAEFQTGSIGNQLTFESRRGRTYLAKLVAIFTWMVGTGVAATGLSFAGAWLVGALVKAAAGKPVGGLSHMMWLETRTALIGAVTALAAAGVAFLARHTAPVVGVAIASVVIDSILTNYISRLTPYSLMLNLQAVLTGQANYYTQPCGNNGNASESCQPIEHIITGTHGSIYLAALALVLAIVGWLAFRRRDVN